MVGYAGQSFRLACLSDKNPASLSLCSIGQNQSGRLILAAYCICKFNMENGICALRGSASIAGLSYGWGCMGGIIPH